MSGAACAQINVAVYGIVDLRVKYQAGLSPDRHVWPLASGQQCGSRIGFRGTEDLGGGQSADFVLENGFNADDGSFNNGGRLFGRQMWAGLKGGGGAVYLGRQYSTIYNALDASIHSASSRQATHNAYMAMAWEKSIRSRVRITPPPTPHRRTAA